MKNILSKITPAVKHILFTNILVYLFVVFFDLLLNVNINFEYLGAYCHISDKFNPAQIITYMFTHDIGVSHIVINMFLFLLFAPNFENKYGYKLTIISYIIFGISSYFCFDFGINKELYYIYGSSGAVIGFSFVFFMNNILKWKKIIYNLLFLIFLYEIYVLFQTNDPIRFITAYGHLGGIIGSVIVFIYLFFTKKGKQNFPFSYINLRF